MLTVYEIYLSIQGESTHVGRPCVFVRLTACDLRCRWCDTPYAFTGGRKMSIDEVVAEVARLKTCTLVELTGGEPLLQQDVVSADGAAARRAACEVLLETGGHVPIADVPDEVVAHRRREVPGERRGGEDALAQPRRALAARRSEVRHRRPRATSSTPATSSRAIG